ncbi:histidine kinase N-terminal 7TM domain-containing protein [Natronosalvus vescus]|uniref:sensor histidine kinase n=1 Tax=Natronosalvus vescus TaxID=2953881 RepID=UPI002091BA1C|nr:histidine kinase N-terminal 7TM domain-containing protein [Natronosalvus vescus]
MIEGTLFMAGLVMATVLSAVLGGMTWRYRRRPGATPFLLLVAGLGIWTGMAFLASVDPSPERTRFWYYLTYAGIPTVVLGWFLFALEFTGHEEWITPKTVGLLLVEPVAVQLVVWTNEYHNLFWRDLPENPLNQASYELLFWIHVLYSYGLLLAGSIILVSFVLYSKTLYRDQVAAILFACSVPWGTNMVYLFTSFPTDLTPLAIGVSSIAFAWSMFRYGFMDVVPIARDTVIDEMSDGVLVLDAHCRIVDYNRAIHPLIAAEESTLVGSHVTDVFAFGRFRAVDEEPGNGTDAASANLALEAFFDESIETERTIEVETVVSDSGSPRAFSLTLSPFYARKSTQTGQLLVSQEITISKRRERQLSDLAAELEHRTREQSALIENIPGLVYRMPEPDSGTCSFVSTAAMAVTGYPPAAFESGERSLNDLVHGEERQRVLEQKQAAIADRSRYDVTYRIRTGKDGTRWVRDVGEGIVTDDGDLASVVGVIIDVTENKEREQLQVLNRVLRHNIRNEMNVIKGYAGMAAANASEEVAPDLAVVRRKSKEVMRMSEKARIVQQLLGTQSGANRTLNLVDALANALARIDDRYGERVRGRVDVTVSGALDTHADGDDPFENDLFVTGSDLLAVGLYELLENAILHGGDSPTLEIDVRGRDGTAELRIADTGPGLPETERRVLEDGLESPLEHGSGMGLWIAQWVFTPDADLAFDADDDGTTVCVTFGRSGTDRGDEVDRHQESDGVGTSSADVISEWLVDTDS